MYPFPTFDQLKDLIQLARREDLGAGDDVTSRLMVPEDAVGVGTLVQKEVGVVCGLPIVEMVCRAYDERLRGRDDPRVPHGDHRGPLQRRAARRRCCACAGRCGRCCRPSGSC